MTAVQRRERLPNRRLGETFELEVAGLRYTATVGRFPDGRIAELFLQNHKSASGLTRRRAIARLFAPSLSSAAPTLKPSAGRCAVTCTAARADPLERRSIASPQDELTLGHEGYKEILACGADKWFAATVAANAPIKNLDELADAAFQAGHLILQAR